MLLLRLRRHCNATQDISVGNMLLNVHYGVPGVYSSFARRNIALAYIDFGGACRFPAGSDQSTWVGTGHWGTVDHAAPEIPRGDNRHSQKPYHLPPVDVRRTYPRHQTLLIDLRFTHSDPSSCAPSPGSRYIVKCV